MVLPSLLWYYQLAQPGTETTYRAFATSLAVTSVSSFFSAYFGFKEGRLDVPALKRLALPAFIGAFAGALVGMVTKPVVLKLCTALMLLYLGIKLVRPAVAKAAGHSTGPVRALSTWVVGSFSGLIYSLAGAGGASVLTLHLLKAGLDAKKAITTTSALVGFIGIAAVLGFGDLGRALLDRASYGGLDATMVLFLAPAVLLGSWLGNKASQFVNAKQLRTYLGCLLLVLSAALLIPALLSYLPT